MNRVSRFFTALLVPLALSGSAFGQFGAPNPTWSPETQIIQGNQPIVAGAPGQVGTNPFTFTLKAPSTISPNTTVHLGIRVPANVGGNPGVPAGMDPSAVLGYCTLSTTAVTFPAAATTVTVTAYLNVPTPVTAGNYYWNIYVTDWPSSVTSNPGYTRDVGCTINANVLPPVINPDTPPVLIDVLPVLGTNYKSDGVIPVQVPISFTATSVPAPHGATISQVKVQFDAIDLTPSLTTSGLSSAALPDGTFRASASVNYPTMDAGPHTIYFSATSAGGTGYATTQINILAPPKITNSNNPTFTYGAPGTFVVTTTGWPAAVCTAAGLPAGLTISPSGVISGTPTAAVGTYTVTVTAANTFQGDPVGSDTHDFTLTINPRPITVTADAKSKIYGDADPSLTYSVTGGTLVPGDTLNGALARAAGENVGIYAIGQGGLSAGSNYNLTYVGANLSVAAKTLTATATANNKTYDGTTVATFTASPVGVLASDAGAVSVTGGSASFADKNVGTAKPITISGLALAGAAAGNYSLSPNTATATANISAAPIAATADAITKVYGAADPVLTYKVTSGSLASGDTWSGSLVRASGENVGTYAINQGTLSAGSNYALTFVDANLTVTAKPITITADAKSKVYGGTEPALTYTMPSGSLVGTDQLSGALSRVVGENVGTYAISQGTLAATSNYALTFVGANLTITAKPITVTADAKSKVYGTADPTLTYTVTTGSLASGDAFTGALTRDAGENVNTYPIKQGTLSAGANYNLTYVGANLAVTAKTLTATATANNKTYDGTTAATFNASPVGVLASDTGAVSVTGGSASFADKDVGIGKTVTITSLTLSGAAAGNYSLSPATATATANITAAPLTITASNATKVYGAANPTLIATYSGFVGSDTSAVVTGLLLGTTATATSNVGTYPITGSSASAKNYAISYVAGTLTITKAALAVTADNKSMNAGSALPAFTSTVTGLVNGDTSAVLGTLTYSTTATTTSPAGTYPITVSGPASTTNYTVTYVAGTLTVTGTVPGTCGTAIVRHGPDLNGNAGIDGSLQVLLPERFALDGNVWISKDLLVPGMPTIRMNDHPLVGSVINGTGAATPAGQIITLNGNDVVGRIVRRTDAVIMPTVPTPPTATGTRDVRLNKSTDSAGTFATVRDLTVSGNVGQVAVPAGTYRDLTATGGNGFTLGVAGATTPSVYYVRNLKLAGYGDLKIVGPVVLTVTDDFTFDGTVGSSAHPAWLTLNLYSGDLTLNGRVELYAYVLAPFGTVRMDGLAILCGGLKCDQLIMNGYALLDLCGCDGYGRDGCNRHRDHGDDDDCDHRDHDDHDSGSDHGRGGCGG